MRVRGTLVAIAAEPFCRGVSMWDTCFVLSWRYRDGSGCGVHRAYLDADRATDDLALVKEDCTREWAVNETPIWLSQPLQQPTNASGH